MEYYDIINYYLNYLPIIIGAISFPKRLLSDFKLDRGVFLFSSLMIVFLIKDFARSDYDGVLEQLNFFRAYFYLLFIS
jgi:hypothetical protein